MTFSSQSLTEIIFFREREGHFHIRMKTSNAASRMFTRGLSRYAAFCRLILKRLFELLFSKSSRLVNPSNSRASNQIPLHCMQKSNSTFLYVKVFNWHWSRGHFKSDFVSDFKSQIARKALAVISSYSTT